MDPSPPVPAPSPQSQEQWFAIWTRSRHEQVVREQLERKQVRRVSADDPAVEPLERPEEEDRLAAVPRLLFRPLRSGRHAGHPEVRGRREHRLVRGETGAHSGVRARQHPAARRQRAAIRPVSDDSRRHDGRGRARPVARRGWTAAAQGREEGEPRALRRFDRSGRVGRSRCG